MHVQLEQEKGGAGVQFNSNSFKCPLDPAGPTLLLPLPPLQLWRGAGAGAEDPAGLWNVRVLAESGAAVHADRVTLAGHSAYFSTLFQSAFQEAGAQEVGAGGGPGVPVCAYAGDGLLRRSVPARRIEL